MGLRKIPYVSALLTLVAPPRARGTLQDPYYRYGVAVAVAGILGNSVTRASLNRGNMRQQKKEKVKKSENLLSKFTSPVFWTEEEPGNYGKRNADGSEQQIIGAATYAVGFYGNGARLPRTIRRAFRFG